MNPKLKQNLLLILAYLGGLLDYSTEFFTLFAESLNLSPSFLTFARVAMWVVTILGTMIRTGAIKELKRRFAKNNT